MQAAVAAFDRFPHAGKIVAQNSRGFFGAFGHGFAADDEFTVIGFFHLAGFPDDHRGDGFGTLDVRDVEAFDALGRLGQTESGFEGFDDRVFAGLGNAEARDERLLRVFLDQFEERVLLAALRIQDFDAMAGFFGEDFFEQVAIVEIERRVDEARKIFRIEI